MDSERRLSQVEPEEIFAEAITRVEAGEPIDGVIASYPAEHHAELHDMLQIVAMATQLQQAPVPRPSAAQRAARKAAFLQAAAELRVERAVNVPAAPVAKPVRNVTLAEQWQNLVSALQAIFNVRTMRLAPLVFVLTLFLLSSLSLVALAQEAIPGDLTYPVKQWIRYQQLSLSPPAMRSQVLKEHEEEFQKDVQKAAAKAEQAAGSDPDKNRVVIKTNSILTFHNDDGAFMVVGGLRVLKKYQPDANKDQELQDMVIEGKPVPGEQVVLEYQILPQSGNTAAPLVQGIRLRVLTQAPLVPTPIPTSTPTFTNTPIPTYTPAPTEPCVVTGLHGWVPTHIQAGDTLSAIAQRTGSTVAQLLLVNCLTSAAIPANGVLLAPAAVATPTPLPTVELPTAATPTGDVTLTTTPAEATPTDATPVPTLTEATPSPAATGTEATVTTPASTVVATGVETTTAEPPTAVTTVLPTTTAATTPVATASGTTAEPTLATTPVASVTGEPSGTAEPSTTPSVVATPEPSTVATGVATAPAGDTPTAVTTPAAAETPTVVGSSAATPTVVQTSAPVPTTQVEPPTATLVEPTAVSTQVATLAQPTQAPPATQAPPTQAPATQAPPTQIPPTQAAPVQSTPAPTQAAQTQTNGSKRRSTQIRPTPTRRARRFAATVTPTPVNVSPVR